MSWRAGIGATCLALCGFANASVAVAETVMLGAAPVAGISAPETPPRSIYSGNYFIVGAGIANLPQIEGRPGRGIYPAVAVMGRYHGITINPRAAGIAIDLIQDPKDSRLGISFGPVVRWRAGRSGKAKDQIIASLGRIRGDVEAGVTAGFQIKRLANQYDSLSIGGDIRWDASNGTGSRIIAVGPSYFTPVSKAQVVGLSATFDFVNRRYAHRTYGVTPSGSTASGLPEFNGRQGLRSIGFKAYTAYDLDSDLRNGGFAVGLGVGYSVLMGSAAKSPIIQTNGRRNAFQFITGVAYAF